MSARSAGRIAAITTGKALGVPVRDIGAASVEEPETPAGGPLIPQIEPGAAIGSGERAALASLVSYVPGEALTIYLAGVACVNLVQTSDTSGEKVAAVWLLFVIALVANAAFVWLAFRDKFKDFSRRELTVRQTRPLVAAVVTTSLAFFVFALAIPGGVFISSPEWLPLILLIGTAVVIGIARVWGLGPLKEDPPVG
ncbi:hypothetical protein [Amnibacterium kyonggiense]|uniref:Uncharacterized protein n=1 Tax=Amnibacterium kyonggiense TaxID=595671 RepID=A0A4R7FEQ2_9MICO|nr:hypothetical protein [Amnibacterium kyonggiense]TDS74926.1 hypothetical protein CLV52_3450 [Amnibacterium kyonggiense]